MEIVKGLFSMAYRHNNRIVVAHGSLSSSKTRSECAMMFDLTFTASPRSASILALWCFFVFGFGLQLTNYQF
jgi:hypothetical protein